uniref:Uncharacterized protein n=1 Tax=Oryza nivara TaxID=4536 RepID=A0A0E0HD81_ORYNI
MATGAAAANHGRCSLLLFAAIAMVLLVFVATTTATAARDVRRPAAVEKMMAAVMRHDVPSSGPSPVHNGAPTPPAAANEPTVAVTERLVPPDRTRCTTCPVLYKAAHRPRRRLIN